jgi:hypothetical protein
MILITVLVVVGRCGVVLLLVLVASGSALLLRAFTAISAALGAAVSVSGAGSASISGHF